MTKKEYKRGRIRATVIVYNAVKNGALPNLKNKYVICRDCRKSRAIHYDHRDYNKPLDVTPLCMKCNYKRGPGKARIKPKKLKGIICKRCLRFKKKYILKSYLCISCYIVLWNKNNKKPR